jgi:hypothetical protein
MAMKNAQSVKRLSPDNQRRLFGTEGATAALCGEFRSRSSTRIIIANCVVTRELSDSQATQEFWRDLALCCALILLPVGYLAIGMRGIWIDPCERGAAVRWTCQR